MLWHMRKTWGDRPPSHSALGCSAHSSLDSTQKIPFCLSASRTVVARPALFLFPNEFLVKAWRVVLDVNLLRVCQIQPLYPHSICSAIGSKPAPTDPCFEFSVTIKYYMKHLRQSVRECLNLQLHRLFVSIVSQRQRKTSKTQRLKEQALTSGVSRGIE